MAPHGLIRSAFLFVFAALAIAMPLRVAAAPAPVAAPQPCRIASDQPLDAPTLLQHPERFDCNAGEATLHAKHLYGLFAGLSLVNDPSDPWELRHEYSQADAQAIYVRYADGRIERAPSNRRSARRLFSPGMVSYALPQRPGTITSVLVTVDNLRNQRGIAPAAEFKTGRAAMEGDLVVLLLYGMLAGVVGGLLIYNFALWVSLRYNFILCYCLGAIAMIAMGLGWSGGIFAILPGLDTNEQISFTMLCTVSVLAVSVLFVGSFIERQHLPRRLWRLTMAAALVGLASCVTRIVDGSFAWMAMDRISYGSIIAILVGLVAIAGVAARRGSAAGRIYLMAWSVPIGLGIARAVWAMNIVGGISILIAMSPLFLLAIEALMSALAVSWRVGRLRTERDEAHALGAHLRTVADTDDLTGLLNRRAFIEQVLSPRAGGRDRLMVIDIDQFKLVNDRHGHQAGDDVLAMVGSAIAAAIPEGAIAGRMGGEEFAVLAPAEPVDALAERLCRAVADAQTADGHSVTISVGVADGHIVDDAAFRLVYYAADQALYRSKHGGRNRVSHAPIPLAA